MFNSISCAHFEYKLLRLQIDSPWLKWKQYRSPCKDPYELSNTYPFFLKYLPFIRHFLCIFVCIRQSNLKYTIVLMQTIFYWSFFGPITKALQCSRLKQILWPKTVQFWSVEMIKCSCFLQIWWLKTVQF